MSAADTLSAPSEPTLRAESEALLAALIAGIGGAVIGIVLALTTATLALSGSGGFGSWAAVVAAAAAAATSVTGYARSRSTAAQVWRQDLANWRYVVSAASVMVAHAALAGIVTLALFAILAQGFIGLELNGFWMATLLALAGGLAAYWAYLSSSQLTTQRLTSVLVTFIAVGSLAAMVTTSDPDWWKLHFSQLGTFGDLSSFFFNGTLIAAGALVTTFTLYVGQDIARLQEAGVITSPRAVPVVTTTLAIMGIMLACVGIFPVDEHLWLHNLSASGMAAMYLVLLIGGPRILRGMPRAYFLASWEFLAALVASIVLFAVGFFSLSAFEIIVFALVFGWLAVFIRFLGVAGQPAL